MIKPKKECVCGSKLPLDKCCEALCKCGSGKKWKDCHGRSKIPC